MSNRPHRSSTRSLAISTLFLISLIAIGVPKKWISRHPEFVGKVRRRSLLNNLSPVKFHVFKPASFYALKDIHPRGRRRSRSNNNIRNYAEHETLQDYGTPIPGKNKYLGATGFGSAIIGIPSHASYILKIQPGSQENGGKCKVTTFGELPKGKKYQWLRGVVAEENNCIYAIPCWANSVIKIDPIREEVSTFTSEAIREGETWQWHGGCLGEDGNIYGIPCNAKQVLRIDPKSESIELIGDELPGQNKWYGGIIGRDKCIYGIPYTSEHVLRINPRTSEVTRIEGPFPASEWNWHGGVRAPDGSIIGIPSHAQRVLKITPPEEEDAEVQVKLIGGPYPGKYKWGGACVGGDNNVYGIPSDINKVLRVNPVTEEVELLNITGNLIDQGGETIAGLKNLWQGAVLAPNGHIFAIPCNAETVLRIIPSTSHTQIDMIGSLPRGKDKWQGGYLGEDGNVYGIPQNSEFVLKIVPENGEVSLVGLSLEHC